MKGEQERERGGGRGGGGGRESERGERGGREKRVERRDKEKRYCIISVDKRMKESHYYTILLPADLITTF